MTAITSRRNRLTSLMNAQAAAALPAPAGKLEIADIQAHPVREPVSHRVYSIVRVRTRNGLIGFGEGSAAAPADLATAQQFWVGRQATAYVTLGPPSPLASAIEMALLDIIGKACAAPVYRLLGGPTRHKVRVFAALTGAQAGEQADSLGRAAEAGFQAFSVPVPTPKARNQGQAYQRELKALLDTLRSGQRSQLDFVLAGDASLTPGDAAVVAAAMQPLHPLWFDEPCALVNLPALHKITDESVVPLGFGRDIADLSMYQSLLREGLIDVIRPDLARHSITQIRRIAALAETYYTAVAPRHTGGPLATAAALHLAATLPNFFIQQIPLPSAKEDKEMRAALAGAAAERVKDGFASLPTTPGLGVTINQAALEKYHAA